MSFDLKTHVRDKKNGQVLSENNYKLVLDNGIAQFERPIGSGTWYGIDGSFLRQDKVEASAKFKDGPEADQSALLAKIDELEAKLSAVVKTEYEALEEAEEPETEEEAPKAFTKPSFLK